MGTIMDKKAWAEVFLKSLGNPNPSANTIKFVQAWEIQESGTGAVVACDHNPLNTMQDYQGAGKCNAAGVKTYQGYDDGVNASIAVLNNGLYPTLEHALKTNDENNLGFNGHTMATNIASDLSVWSTGQRTPVNAHYANAILTIAGEPNIPSGGDIGQVTPDANPSPQDITAGLGAYFSGINTLFSNPTRVIKGAAGVLLILIGVVLGIKQLTGFDVAKTGVKVAKGFML